jgi:hypothetical protein
MVQAGELRYYMIGSRDGRGDNASDEVAQWVRKYGTVVDSSVWSSSSGFGMKGNTSQTLYDLAASKNQ